MMLNSLPRRNHLPLTLCDFLFLGEEQSWMNLRCEPQSKNRRVLFLQDDFLQPLMQRACQQRIARACHYLPSRRSC